MRTPHTLLLLCMLSLAGPTAVAASPETTVMTDKARKLFQEGNAALKRRNFLEAHASYLAAWALNPHWQIAANLADAELELGKNREAAEHATYYQKNAPNDRQVKAIALLDRALARVVKLTINVDPPGAEVFVDDASVGHAPLAAPIFVDPGAHQVTARFPGRPEVAQSVTFAAGRAEAVSLAMPPAPSPPHEASSANVGGPSPAPSATSSTPPDLPPLPPERRPLWPALLTGGAGIIVIAVGGGLTGAASAKRADAAALRAKPGPANGGCASPVLPGAVMDCQAIQSDVASHDALNKAALGSFVVGGALAVAGAGLGVWAARGPKDEKSTKPTVRVAPLAGWGAVGAVIGGVW